MKITFFISVLVHLILFLGALSSTGPRPPTSRGGGAPEMGIFVEREKHDSNPTRRVPLPKKPSVTVSSDLVSPGPASPSSQSAGSTEGNVSLGEVIKWGNSAPEYPPEAMRKGWEGEVKLRLYPGVEQNRVEILSSSGFDILDEAALGAALHWKVPEGSSAWIVPVDFRLREGRS